MHTKRVRINIESRPSGYEILIGHRSLAGCGAWAKAILSGKSQKIAIISNSKVFRLYGELVRKSLTKAGFDPVVHLIKDGERHKDFRTLQEILSFFAENGLTRTDAVTALGGGVVGDLAGFAASIYLRGIRFLQIPTTLLAMIDSSVGGKTGVNSGFGKNLIGSFCQPSGVLIDVETLVTLPRRELTAGFCEAIKQGAIADQKLFEQISGFLEKYPVGRFRTFFDKADFIHDLGSLLAAQTAFKARIVQGDEREDPENTTAESRKVLNFGHTFAHALEKATDYRYLKHGEAVGYGIIFAAEVSKKLGLLERNELDLLCDTVRSAGKRPPIGHVDRQNIAEAFGYDKKFVNNSLHWILLKGIGKPVIFPHAKIPQSAFSAALDRTLGIKLNC